MHPIFRKNFSVQYFLVFIITIILALILFRRLAIFFILTLFAAVFVYINYHIKLPFDISPVLFLSLIISAKYNFIYSFFFIIVSGIIPMVLAGGSFDHTTIFYLSLILIINLVCSYLKEMPFLIIAVALVILHHMIAAFGSVSFGNQPYKEMANFFLKIFVDCFYLLTFSGAVIAMIG